MKYKHYIYAFLLSSAGVLNSCDINDLLDTKPSTSISAEEIFTSPERIEGLVNGVYKALKAASLYGGRYLLYSDVRGEDFINVTGNNYTAYESWSNAYTASSNDINNLWSQAYTTINNANILIEGLKDSEGVIDDELKNQYIAEGRFVRALSYFSLVTVYARPYVENEGASKGLPLRLQPETNSLNNDLARSTVKEIYKQILEDLDFAEENLPEKYENDYRNTTHAHRNTAIALKTRVYLTMGLFNKVIEEAVKIVPQQAAPYSATSGVNHALQEDIVTIFHSNYTTVESILSMPMAASNSLSGQSAIGYVYNVNEEYYLNPSGILEDELWGENDQRRELLRQSSDKYYLYKYAKSSPYVDYIPVIRYSEVLLNYSEAAARTGDLDLANRLLQAVHHRSDAGFDFSSYDLNSENGFIDIVRRERRIELLGEGLRSNDLLRDLLTIPSKGAGGLQAGAVSPSDENYIFPLPNTEINANKLLLEE